MWGGDCPARRGVRDLACVHMVGLNRDTANRDSSAPSRESRYSTCPNKMTQSLVIAWESLDGEKSKVMQKSES